MDVSVIIVNYNTLELTRNCINSIVEQTDDVGYEIILVDNASSDGSREFFEHDSRLTFIGSDINLGFGKANNLGYEYARGEFVFFLNSDTILLNNAIKYFYRAMTCQKSDVACMGGVLLSAGGDVIHSYADFISIKNLLSTLAGIYKLPFCGSTNSAHANNYPLEVEYITGADLFVRREVIEKQGLFDPDFFMYFEETQMQWRYAKAGYRMMIIPEPQIVHLEGASCAGVAEKRGSVSKDRMYFNSMLLFCKKRYGRFHYYLSRMVCLGFIPLFLLKGYGYSGTVEMVKVLIGPIAPHKI